MEADDSAAQASNTIEEARALLAGSIGNAGLANSYSRRPVVESEESVGRRQRGRSVNEDHFDGYRRSPKRARHHDDVTDWTGGAYDNNEQPHSSRSRSPGDGPRYSRQNDDETWHDGYAPRYEHTDRERDPDRRLDVRTRERARRSPPRSRGPPVWRGDWMCSTVGCASHNYGRRDECYVCKGPRKIAGVPIEHAADNSALAARAAAVGLSVAPAVSVPTILAQTGGYGPNHQPIVVRHGYTYDSGAMKTQGASFFPGGVGPEVFSRIPTRALVVRGVHSRTSVDYVLRAMKNFAPIEAHMGVKMPPLAALLEDVDMSQYDSGDSRAYPNAGFVLLVYASVEAAMHVLRQCNDAADTRERADVAGTGIGWLVIDGECCEVTFAREDCIVLESGFLKSQVTAFAQHGQAFRSGAAGTHSAATPHNAQRMPLHFDTHGSLYVFDVTSGLFFEHSRQFWYDSASKLYLDALQWQYYSWDAKLNSFIAWAPPLPEGSAPTQPQNSGVTAAVPSATQTTAFGALTAGAAGAMMARWKKNKEIAKAPSAATATTAFFEKEGAIGTPGPSARGTGHAAKKVASPSVGPLVQQQPSLGDLLPLALPAASAAIEAVSELKSSKTTVVVTQVAVACKLCQRGFKTYDTLLKHIEQSELHKKNLDAVARGEMALPEGLQLEDVQNPPNPSTTAPSGAVSTAISKPGTRDRAAERRQIVGVGAFEAPAPPASVSTKLPTAGETLAAAADTPIDTANNVGASLLAKMGWKQGEGLGKHAQGRIIPVDATEGMGGVLDGMRKGLGSESSDDWSYRKGTK